MISAKDEGGRLREARSIYERTCSHYETAKWVDEVDRDERYYHGDQWAAEDVEYLRKQKRPALTFNVIQSKLLHLIGSHEDNLQEPTVVGTGIEDAAMADVLNRLRSRVAADVEQMVVDAEVFENGIVCGIGNAAIDAMPDPADPARVKVVLRSLHPLEVLWDPAAERRDRSDARYVVLSRWLSRSEFRVEYPDHAEKIDEIWERLQSGTGLVTRTDPADRRIDQDRRTLIDMRYYDRHQDQVRVTRIEYRKAGRVRLAFDPETGASREVTPDVEKALRAVAPDVEIGDHWREEIRWIEFIGDAVLYDDVSPLPVNGFTVSSFVCHSDHRGLPYGKVRQLRDPQSEVNKRFSQMLYLLMQQSQPGVFAEVGAFVDARQAEESLKQAGSVTHLNTGGMQKIQPRPVPQFPDAPAMVHEHALKLLTQISGIWQDQLMEPRGVPEAAATAQLHYRQSLLAMRPVIRGFEQYQRQVALRVLELIVGIFPDEQIAEMLGNDERWQVRGRVVTDRQTGVQVPLSSIRDLKWQVELVPADENNTQRLLEMQMLVQLMGVGMPIDPEVVIEMMPLSADKQDRMRAFITAQREGAGRAAQAEAESAEKQLKTMAMLEAADRQIAAGKLAETTRHNKALEMLSGMKVGEAKRSALASETVEGGKLAVDVHRASMERERMVQEIVMQVVAALQTGGPLMAPGDAGAPEMAQEMPA